MALDNFIVRLNPSSTEEDLKAATKSFEDQGGKVLHHHTLFKGFTGQLPADKITTFQANPHVEAVEKDQKVSIQ